MVDSNVFTKVNSLKSHLQGEKKGKNIGFIPTMGALHEGHLSLVRNAFKYSDIVVVSIFVNPAQFNNPNDLEKYPRNIDQDVELLNTVGEVIVFVPSVEEVYPSDYKSVVLDLGSLATVMEGKYRQGHFDGVVNVVKRLFDIIQPDYAFFGLKDFQQLAVIQYMVTELNVPVSVIPCEIIRNEAGLALSSRNARLSQNGLHDVVLISRVLRIINELAGLFSPDQVKEIVKEIVLKSRLELEYIEIVNPSTLLSINQWESKSQVCIAAYCDEVRLIDNMQLTIAEF